MKKYLALMILPLLLLGATFKTREVNQNWKFDAPQALDLLDSISGKWVITSPPKIDRPLLTQQIKYADFPKALIKDHEYYDFEASTRMYVSSSSEDTQSGGLILRYRNLYSFYMLFLNTKDKRITLTRASLSGLKVVKRENRPFEPDKWYELKATCNLDHIKVFVDGEPIFEAEDKTSTGGKVGLVTAGTSEIYFDGLAVKTEDIEPVLNAPVRSPQTQPQTQTQPHQ